jgi:hypothetical protein
MVSFCFTQIRPGRGYGIQYAYTDFSDELKDLPVEQSITGLPMKPKRELLG